MGLELRLKGRFEDISNEKLKEGLVPHLAYFDYDFLVVQDERSGVQYWNPYSGSGSSESAWVIITHAPDATNPGSGLIGKRIYLKLGT